ncbi:hypothetical protein FisN_4Lh378 [Fistulifera solaris]|uniref:Ion transport domain-containing protein n=1 Tax=Fistulifera solaris TaxID=1519565 RepID=A0A1Z5JZZ9_FISSO|nr:hypothetical protein FisN_4Lh378 [Fistulifera solaris]|eukprot:GAX19398.1 hypothetical protein FisN_4Lh378 [Fistulifera solaris]
MSQDDDESYEMGPARQEDERMHNMREEASFLSDANDTFTTVDDSVPDVMLLNFLCARAKAPKDTPESHIEAEESWHPVREWLSSRNAIEVRAAAEQRGESGLTALHFACRHVPPLDVIDVLLSIAADTVRWPDSFGWLPIHYLCASGSSAEVIKALADAYPESKTAVDRRGRTPLHFALGDKPASPDVIFLLSSSGAAKLPDEIGMLPLHYACAFGASEEVLYVLTDAYPEAIQTKDKRDRTPLHFALSNAGRKSVPSAVRLLLSLNREIVNSVDNGPLPLRVLAEYASTVRTEDDKREEKQESVFRCLEHLLNANPEPSADFLTALQSLPVWLSEKAVVMPIVQNLLNEKISQRFPTAVLMLDFYVLVMIIVFYFRSVEKSIKLRFNDDPNDDALGLIELLPLYIGGSYFTLREIVQVISLMSLKSLNLYLYDSSNSVNLSLVFLVFFWIIRMNTGTGDRDYFRVAAAVSASIMWLKLLSYLRNMMIDFAVFVGGVFYVVRRLVAFLTALIVILIAFAQMFHTTFQQTPYCLMRPEQDPELTLHETRCEVSQIQPYCNLWDSFLSVYTMLLGEVDESSFSDSGVATALFIVFMFLVVILLANVLIAIVSDSYKVIQDQRAAIVFWTNRLDFVSEMDAIANYLGPLGVSQAKSRPFGKDLWKQITELFEDEVEEGYFSFDFLAYTLLRVVAAVFIIPLWILLGLLTMGWFWPPQIREAVFTSVISKHSSDIEMEDELRKTQVKKLEEEVNGLKYELLQELALDRTQVMQMKSLVAEKKHEIVSEMNEIKKLVAVLFEREMMR